MVGDTEALPHDQALLNGLSGSRVQRRRPVRGFPPWRQGGRIRTGGDGGRRCRCGRNEKGSVASDRRIHRCFLEVPGRGRRSSPGRPQTILRPEGRLMPSFEVLLPIGAIAFYVYDSALLLYGNELALERADRVAHLHRTTAADRASTSVRAESAHTWCAAVSRTLGQANSVWRTAMRWMLKRCGPARVAPSLVTLQALLCSSCCRRHRCCLGAGRLLLAVFVLYYVFNLAGLGILIVKRSSTAGPGRRIAWLALESLLCAPFAANIVRKVAFARSEELDWRSIARSNSHETQRTMPCMQSRLVLRSYWP